MPRRSVSLRAKLLGIVAVTFAIVGGGLWLSAYVILNDQANHALDARIEGLSKSLAGELTDYVLMNDLYTVRRILKRAQQQHPDLAYAYLLSPGGDLLTHTFDGGFPDALLDLGQRERIASEAGPVRQRQVELLGGQAGSLWLGVYENVALDGVRRTLANLALALLLGGLAAALVAGWMTKAFLAPVRGMVAAVENLEKGRRAQVPVPNDELGVLGRALERFSETARRRSLELRTLNLLGQRLNKTLDPQEMLRATLNTLVETRWFSCAEALSPTAEGGSLLRVGCKVAPSECPALRQLQLGRPVEGFQTLEINEEVVLALSGGTASEAFLAAVADYLRNGLERARVHEHIREKELERRRLLQALLRAQEEERGRIAKDLHDQVGQSLTALRLGLEALEPAPPTLHALKRLVETTLSDVRRIGRELRPAALDELGLEAALRRMVQEMAGFAEIESDVFVHCSRPLPPELETVLYRVAQEALTNVVRHARAKHVSVLLKEHNRHVQLVVEDDGTGFDPRRVSESSSGLIGMRERVELVGGELVVESNAGEGTSIYARVPLPVEVRA
ncbi:sensor histidine kinase [Oceanithermus desulfurans]|uniref:histidine kinase n=2 Tax=Oceanithermus desulfurans TaxID=227924 RepID=A0A511RJJ4_9DEIN|nr:ATP-binding protein [Oceanithermus desulfurans]MBB6029852.1 signal transduction histidine kinase [Oceanithermus desulfurans]GEM89813.1 hypothetical protein ODE01S_12470 [Oceanithermus desulfurans NBRC 100063]